MSTHSRSNWRWYILQIFFPTLFYLSQYFYFTQCCRQLPSNNPRKCHELYYTYTRSDRPLFPLFWLLFAHFVWKDIFPYGWLWMEVVCFSSLSCSQMNNEGKTCRFLFGLECKKTWLPGQALIAAQIGQAQLYCWPIELASSWALCWLFNYLTIFPTSSANVLLGNFLLIHLNHPFSPSINIPLRLARKVAPRKGKNNHPPPKLGKRPKRALLIESKL